MALSKAKREEITAQAVSELAFARRYKQGKIANWQKNENLYYGRKDAPLESRANVDLGRMQEFVHTLLSKIDNPLVFKFVKRKESQLKRVKRLNALREIDQQYGDWDIKDIAGKKQAVLYGRAIYSYYADSINNQYCSHLDNVDVYDFLVDPTAGGLDLEKGRYMGRYGVIKDKSQLKEGVKQGLYLRSVVSDLTGDGAGNAEEMTIEETNKRNRSLDTGVVNTSKESGVTTDKFKFWEWYTTFEGERYYLLLLERGSIAIRIEKLTDMFSATKEFSLGAWPFWTWAPFPDLTEFWTPSYSDYVREIFMAQAVSINQMLDNAEQINKPQKVVNVNAIENLAELKYRRDGQIKVKGDFDVNKAIQFIRPNTIDTPMQVFEALEAIQEKASGVTAAEKGVSSDTKVGIYEGNQANAADRFGLLNKSYSFGYKRFAKLYLIGVNDHLTKRVAVDMIGPEGIETEEITRRDIFYKDDEFGVTVEASNAEEQQSLVDQRNKMEFLTSLGADPTYATLINQKKRLEMTATIVGYTDEDVKQLLDNSEYGNAEIISEAERDIEYLLDGKQVKPNKAANLAYKQRFVDYLQDHEEDMNHQQFLKIANYITALEPIIMTNFVREMNTKIQKTQMEQAEQGGGAPPAGAPSQNPAPVSGAPGPDLSIMPAAPQNGLQLPAQGATGGL